MGFFCTYLMQLCVCAQHGPCLKYNPQGDNLVIVIAGNSTLYACFNLMDILGNWKGSIYRLYSVHPIVKYDRWVEAYVTTIVRPHTGDIGTWNSQWPPSQPLWMSYTPRCIVFWHNTWQVCSAETCQILQKRLVFFLVYCYRSPQKMALRIPTTLWGWDLKPFLWRNWFLSYKFFTLKTTKGET